MKLVDADVLIDYSKGYLEAVQYFYRYPDLRVLGILVTTKLEYLDGARNKMEMHHLLDFLGASDFVEVFPSSASMTEAVEVFTQYHLSKGIGIFDSMLAGFALTTDSTVVTRNRKHFDFIPGLKLETPF